MKIDDIPVDATRHLRPIDIGHRQRRLQRRLAEHDYADVPVTATLPIVDETTSPRNGYSIIDTTNAPGHRDHRPSIVKICGSGIGGAICAESSTLRQEHARQSDLQSQIGSILKNELQAQLCTKPDPTVTPALPRRDGGRRRAATASSRPARARACRRSSALDGHMDLGTLVAKYSPGNTAAVDLVLAASGNADPSPGCRPNQTWTAAGGCATDPSPPYTGHTPNGLTLGMIGGMLPNPQIELRARGAERAAAGHPHPRRAHGRWAPQSPDGRTGVASGDPGPDLGLAHRGPLPHLRGRRAPTTAASCASASRPRSSRR